MLGKRQHVIPRFLLKGFQSKLEGQKIYCWVFPQDGKPYETNIINIAVGKEFYTHKNDVVVDTVITKAELSCSNLIQELRNIKSTSSIRDNRIPQFLAHLEIRTRHLRNAILKSGDIVIHRFIDFINDKEQIERIIRRFVSDSSFITNIVRKDITRRGLPKNFERILIKKVQDSSHIMMKELEPQMSLLIKRFKEELPNLLPAWTKNGQL